MGVLLRRAENNFTVTTTTLGGKRSPLASLSAGRSEQVREGHSSHRKPQDRGGSRSLVGVARLFGQGLDNSRWVPAGYARTMASGAKVLQVPGPEGVVRDVRVSSPDRVMWPESDITKWDLATYVASVEDGLMRALGDRPVTLQRFPQGIGGEEFFSKNPPRGVPEWARSVVCTYPSARMHPQLVIDEIATAVWAVQMNTVTFHPWPVRSADNDNPDELRIDLDPQPGTSFADTARVAYALKSLLKEIGLTGWAKTSGNRGVHVFARISPTREFLDVRHGVIGIARELERRMSAKTNNLFFPTKGYNLSFIIEGGIANSMNNVIGSDSVIALYVQIPASKLNTNEVAYFYRLQENFAVFFPIALDNSAVFGTKFKTGYIQALNGNQELIPPNKTFVAGGTNSVRGWRARQLVPTDTISYYGIIIPGNVRGGIFLVEGSFEYRKKITETIGYALFSDYGNTWNGLDQFRFNSLAVAVGFGARYYSSIAPFRLDFGFKLYDPATNKWIFKSPPFKTIEISFGISSEEEHTSELQSLRHLV